MAEIRARRAPVLTSIRHFTAVSGWCLLLSLIPFSVAAAAKPHSGQKFDDWTVQCSKPPAPKGKEKENPPNSGEEKCFIFQNLVLKKTGQQVLNVAVGHLANDKPAAIFTMPLGISLPQGVSLQIDDGKKIQMPVDRCHQKGCVAGVLLKDDLLSAMKAGKHARVTFHDTPRHSVTVPVSLKGFTAGFESLE